MLVMLFRGQVQFLSMLVIGGTALILMVRYPMAGLLGLLLADAQFLNFIKVDELPYLQAAPSFRINSQDMLTIMLLARAFLVLARRRDRPMFLVPLLLFFCVSVLSFLLGLLSGTSDLTLGGRVFRIVAKYGIYFIIIGTVDSRQRFEIFIKMLYAIAIAGLIVQVIETIRGKYFILNPDWDAFFEEGTPYYIPVGGTQVAYIWNRVPFYLYVTFFLSLASLLSVQRWNLLHLLFIAIASVGFVLQLVRSSFIFVGVGIVTMLFLSGRWLRLARYGLSLALFLLGIALISAFSTQVAFDSTFIGNAVLRLQTLLNFQEEASFIGRVSLWQMQLTYFLQSPLFGNGPGTTALLALNTDTGLVNTLLLFGIAGLLAVFVLIVAILHQSYHLWQQAVSMKERAYVLGVFGVMGGVIVSYAFNMDSFTLLPILPLLIMGILDRIRALYIEA